MSTQRVIIIGPNLPDDSLGTFHVHAVGCRDGVRLNKAMGSQAGWEIDADSRKAIVIDIYSDHMADNAEDPDVVWPEFDDLHLCPCVKLPDETVQDRLEYLRREIQNERISLAELAELAGLADHIDPGDVELLEWAGVPEFDDESEAPAPLQQVVALSAALREQGDGRTGDDLSIPWVAIQPLLDAIDALPV